MLIAIIRVADNCTTYSAALVITHEWMDTMTRLLATHTSRFLVLCGCWFVGAAFAAAVTGNVTDQATGRGVSGATVMVQGTSVAAQSGMDGRYALEAGRHDLTTRQITAWKEGYVIGAVTAKDGRADMMLDRLPPDNPNYAFQPASTCGGCHNDIHAQWHNTSMGRAMGEKLPQKLSFYLGQTTDGKFDGLGFGWKFFAPMMGISQGMHAMDLDHYVGSCTNCHARGATWKKGVLEPHKTYDPDTGHVFIDGALKVFRMDKVADLAVADGREGMTCDVCHSVEDVRINHDVNGRLRTVEIDKMEVIRRGDVKFGPLKDAVSPFHKTAYSPVFKKSEFCAMCHMERADDLEGVGVPSMMTLDEYPAWKANFDAGKTDRQCQDCHMYTGGRGAWSAAKVANVGVERDPQTLYGHHWRGSYFDGEMARRASNLGLTVQRAGEELVVTASVANVGAAHKLPGGPPFRQMLLLVDATDDKGAALAPLDPPRADPAQARFANRIIDVGGGYRENGFFAWWELLKHKPFPQMPYAGNIGKVYNASWVTPPFLPMDWMLRWLWIGILPLLIGLLGWSPWRAMLGGSPVETTAGKGFFSANVGTLDRVLRIAGGALLVAFVPMPWGLLGLVPLTSGVLGWCPTYSLIGGLDTIEKGGFFSRNVGGIDRALRIVGGLALLGLYFWGPRSPWGLIGLVPLVSGLIGWCPTYRLIGNVSTRRADVPTGFATNMPGRSGAAGKGFFSINVGTLDRVLRIAAGVLLVAFVPMPWGLFGLVPLMSGVLGWCPTYFLIGGLDTIEKSGFFSRNVGGVDRALRIIGGLLVLGFYFWGPRSAWGLVGVVPLVSGFTGWCPTYRLIGNVSTRSADATSWFAPNLGPGDRWIRAGGGLFLLSLVFWGPETPWGALGIIPLFTAAIGSCIPYRVAGLDTRSEGERERLFWGPAWTNLGDEERRLRIAAGIMMIFVAVVVPKAFAMQIWPVGGFAAERVLYDTRLDYKEADTTVYRFRAPAGDASIKARLVYLRHWYFMEPIKGPQYWSTDKWKYLLHEVSLTAPAGAKGMLAADAGNRDGSLADMPPIPAEPGAGRWVDAPEERPRVASRQGS